jgi:hypothetical protein
VKCGRAILLGAVFAIYFGALATSATIRTLVGKEGRVVMQIFGQFELGDADVFIGTVKQATAAGKLADRVQLNLTGGKLGEGAKLAAVIKLGRMATFVGSGAVCGAEKPNA